MCYRLFSLETGGVGGARCLLGISTCEWERTEAGWAGKTSSFNAVPAKPWCNSFQWSLWNEYWFSGVLHHAQRVGPLSACLIRRLPLGRRFSVNEADSQEQMARGCLLMVLLEGRPAQHISMEEHIQPSLPVKQLDFMHTASHLAPKAMSPPHYGVFP